MSSNTDKSPAAGASGIPLDVEEKKEFEDRDVLERRLAEVEAKLAAHNITSKACHMCHKPGATIQRGNTGEYFHKPCLNDYRKGKDPLPR